MNLSLTEILLILLLLLLILRCIREYFRSWRYIEKLPGPLALPLIGNIFQIGVTLEDHLNMLLKFWYESGCDKFRGWILCRPYVFLTDPKDIEIVLSSTTLIEKGDSYDMLRPWLGDGLLTSTGLKWHKHRKMITPSFHFKILNDFLEVMSSCGDIFIEKLSKYSKNGEIFDIQVMTSNYTLNVICESAFGTSLTSSENLNSDVVSSVYDLCETIPQRIFSGTKRFDFIYKFSADYRKQEKALKILRKFLSDIINKQRKMIEENGNHEEKSKDSELNIKTKKAFLDNLLTSKIDNCPLTFDEIFEEVSTFMFEGHDTTKSAISFALYILSRYPEIQEKVSEEQFQIFGDDKTRTATYNELQGMNYLELVIKETLRLFPSVPLISRYAREKCNLGNVTIPANTQLVLILIATGRNEKYFKNPMTFDPNRFKPENREKQNPFDSVPFSAGPRNCIGQKFAMMEIKTIISKIIRNYEILPPYEKCCDKIGKHNHDVLDQKLQPPILSMALTLKSENGIRLRLKERKYI